MTVHAYVLIQTDVGRAAHVAQELSRIAGVLVADGVTGPYDVIARAEAPSMNELGRKAEAAPPPPVPELEYSDIGLPLLPRTGRVITCEMVKKLEEEEYDPKNFA